MSRSSAGLSDSSFWVPLNRKSRWLRHCGHGKPSLPQWCVDFEVDVIWFNIEVVWFNVEVALFTFESFQFKVEVY